MRAENGALKQEASALKDRIEVMARTIAELEKKLGCNSQNSSMSPSLDTFGSTPNPERQNRKARRAMGRKPGTHLAQVSDPDNVVPHAPETCRCCGADLSGAELAEEEVCQVFEVSTPRVVVSEHHVYKLRCPCGEVNEGVFPPEARAPAACGPRVRALGLYVLAREHLPFERAAEAIPDLLGVQCSTGFLDDSYRERAGVGCPSVACAELEAQRR